MRYIDQAADTLGAVHATGLVNGDITPNKLLWDFSPLAGIDQAVLSDFRRVDTAELAQSLRKRSGQQTPPVRLIVAVTQCGMGKSPDRPPEIFSNTTSGEPATGSTVRVQPGESIIFEVTADTPGYLTVINLHPSEDTEVLLPGVDGPSALGYLPHQLVVRARPTTEVETAAFVWTAAPERLDAASWRERLLSPTSPLTCVH